MAVKRANVEFAARTEKYERGLKRMSQKSEAFYNRISALNQKANAILLRGAVIQAGAIKLYHDQDQAERQVAAAIRQTGKSSEITVQYVKSLASQLQEVTTFGDETTLTLATMGLRMANLNKEQLPIFLETAQDLSVALGKSLPRGARTLATALADPILGVQTLQSHGVQLTEQQKEMIREFARSGKTLEAQNYMLERLSAQYGGAARTTAEGTGAYIQAKNALGDLGEEMGRIISEYWRPFAIWLKETAEELKENSAFVEGLTSSLRLLFSVGLSIKLFAAVALAIHSVRKAFAWLTSGVKIATIAMRAFWGAATLGASFLIAFAPEIWARWGNTIADTWDDLGRKFDIFISNVKGAFGEMDLFIVESLNKIGLASDEMVEKQRANLEAIRQETAEAEKVAGATYISRDQLDEDKRALELRKKYYDDARQHEREARIRAAQEEQVRHQQELAAEQERIREAEEQKREEAEARREKEEEEAAVRREKEAEIRKMEQEAEIEALRMYHEGVDEYTLERFEFEQEQAAERARINLEREGEEADRLHQLLDLKRTKFYKEQAKKKNKEALENVGKQQAIMKTELGNLSTHLGQLLGEENKFAKLAFAASKAFEVAELLMTTPAKAQVHFMQAAAHDPGPPTTLPMAYAIKYATLASGYTAAAVAGAAAIKSISAETGGRVPGNPALGDAYPYILQAGETVVPTRNYDDLVRGILSRRGDPDDLEDENPMRLEADLQVDLTGDAGKLVQVQLERAEVLST